MESNAYNQHGAPAVAPFVMTREEAPSFWLVDSLWTVLATAETTGNALSLMDQVMPRHSGPPPHVHERLHEYFYLLDGEIRFQLGTELMTASAGAMVSVPPNTVHGFAIVSETARALNFYTPGHFVEQTTHFGTPATELRLPRDGEQRALSPDQETAYLTRSAELNTQRWLSPTEAEDLLADERHTPASH
ncbi:quercetin 2,3-dioxygenase [Mycolicibacterium sp.]|uniref:quercetin 2,3-dioxygenase n=1 Tax=Mycolicibacterium sp. TaxID=2320850 RepID=UPI001A34E3F9|nr:quercetin 2,3-dioxygenase [Mycolicibacterium sp.]MBJ7341537.1 quercetin 2,3-dioxygenase [Mycolicibacterium sp.]